MQLVAGSSVSHPMRTSLLSLALLTLATGTAAADRRGNMGTRLEGAIGARFGSYLVNNVSTGSNVQGHLDGGVRNDRWFVYAEYGLMSLDVPLAEIAARGGGTLSVGNGRALMHRIGGHARYSYGRIGESDGGFDLYAEAGLGMQRIQWDTGGEWNRPDLSLGLGLAGFGFNKNRHGGLGVGLRMMFTPRTDVEGAMPACGGPCDKASAPAGWDRSFLFDISVSFGK
jgi:hypothetical protein